MTDDKIKQIMIDGRMVGIAGLDDAIKKINLSENSEEEIKKNLLKEISANNYVPSSARDAYGKALFMEFQIAQGLAVTDEPVLGLNIFILGMACARCGQLEIDIRNLLSEMKIAANLQHVTDLKEIERYKLLDSPALVINNKVVCVGEVPPKSKIREWIIEAYTTNQ